MSNDLVPTYLQDAAELLSDDGFATGDVWYHGTASGLLEGIQKQGLKRSGDKASSQSIKQTMATIGNTYTETIQPVFLTQSKELAYYWAEHKARFRMQRTGKEEMPVVFQVTLNDKLKDMVKGDAGGAGLVIARDAYIEYVESVYEANGKNLGELNPMDLRGSVCLAKLGLAYIDKNIPEDCVELLSE